MGWPYMCVIPCMCRTCAMSSQAGGHRAWKALCDARYSAHFANGAHSQPRMFTPQPTGTLAGSTILLLSLAWGGSVLLGACDLDDKGKAKDKVLTRGWDLKNTGAW